MTKAENGAGSVYQIANGKWVAKIHGTNGKPVTRTCATANMAKRALKELIAQRDAAGVAGVIAPVDLTVADVLDAWLTLALPNRNPAPSTVYAYEAAAANLKRELGNLRTSTLRVRDLDAAFSRMADDGHAKGTLVKARSVLAMAFDFAINREEMSRNLARRITLPRSAAPAKPGRSLDVAQARRMIDAVAEHRWGALFVLALNLGLRPGELLALCWDHVDLDADVPIIAIGRGTRMTRSGRPTLSDEVKTARARRTLVLPPLAASAMRAHKARQMADDLATGVRSDLVFRTTTGTMIEPGNLTRELQRITASLGLGSDWTPNDLRHTAASLLVDQGVPLVVVADILGHTTTRMLEMTYRKNLRPQIDGAVIAMGNLFGAQTTG